MIRSDKWLLVDRFPEATKKYENYVSKISKEKIQYAKLKLNKTDMKILKIINKLQITTSLQLSRFMYKENNEVKKYAIRYINNRLKKLYELGCVDRFFPLVETTKGLDYVHVVIGPVGAKVLNLKKYRRVKNLNQNWKHTVTTNEVLSNLYVRFNIIDWKKEIKLNWKKEDDAINQQPDLFIRYINKEKEKCSFVEVDMGTEPLPTLLKKAKKYTHYFDSNEFKKADWQPYKKNNIAILPEVWFIMKYKKDAISLKNKLKIANSNVKFKIVLLEDIRVN